MAKPLKTPPESSNWYKDRYQHVLLQRKVLTLITLMALLATVTLALYALHLTPLKTVEPFVIQVDQKSGITQTVDPLTVRELTANEAVNNYFLVQYIRARESFSLSEVGRNYNIVRVMSEPRAVYSQFAREADPNNPSSPAARMGASGLRTVKLKSITYLNPQLAQVRVLIEERSGREGGGYAQYHKIILIGFQYIKMNLNNEERYINPLGFRVVEYRAVEDVLPK